jgi:AcrR family transcriptional regulator
MSMERAAEHAEHAGRAGHAGTNDAGPDPVTGAVRRVPTQQRSRRRVEAILDAAERLVLADGVEALTTRAIATEAGVPVASLYQYFGDKEAVLLALAGRDMEEMDAQVASDLAALPVLSVSTVVSSAMSSFVAVYRRRPAFVEIYLRGRTNVAVARFGRAHNVRVATALRDFALERGLCREDLTVDAATLAVEVGDRVFQLAYEVDSEGDAALVEEGITMMTAYLERYATPEGLRGVPA